MNDCKAKLAANLVLDEVILEYNGVVTSSKISEIGSSLIASLNDKKSAISPLANKKLFSSFVEMMQNALYYSPGTDDDKYVYVEIGLNKEKIVMLCGNPIDPSHVERIKSKLTPLTQMSQDEIKLAYKQQLRNELHEEEDVISCGAGLGLMTIAKDASEKIEFEISDNCVKPCALKQCLFIKTVI